MLAKSFDLTKAVLECEVVGQALPCGLVGLRLLFSICFGSGKLLDESRFEAELARVQQLSSGPSAGARSRTPS
eukprot:s225_g46.t1